MTVYELNQQAYASLPELKNEELSKAKANTCKYLDTHNANYYMMLNHDKKYFTIFTYGKDKHVPFWMSEAIIDIAQSLGTLKAIEIEGNMVEIWITGDDNVCRMYALFPYDQGVIEV